MANYEEARLQPTNTQLNKLKSAAKNKTGKTLRITKKNFQDEELTHELFVATGQKTKIRNVFSHSISTDTKRNKAQLSKSLNQEVFLVSS